MQPRPNSSAADAVRAPESVGSSARIISEARTGRKISPCSRRSVAGWPPGYGSRIWDTWRRRPVVRQAAIFQAPLPAGHDRSRVWFRHHIPKGVCCMASMASEEPVISTSAASRRPKRNRSSSPGSPVRRAVGCPRRALMTWSCPAHSRSSPAPRSRRDSNRRARVTLRKSAASSADGWFAVRSRWRGARPRDGRRTR